MQKTEHLNVKSRTHYTFCISRQTLSVPLFGFSRAAFVRLPSVQAVNLFYFQSYL